MKFSEKGKSDISLSYDSYTGLLTSHTGGDNVIKVNISTIRVLPDISFYCSGLKFFLF